MIEILVSLGIWDMMRRYVFRSEQKSGIYTAYPDVKKRDLEKLKKARDILNELFK